MADVNSKRTRRISKQKIKFFQQRLLEWYHRYGRMFKWREPGLSAYEYVIAEVLLQRTKAETISKFYPLFLNEFPSWVALAHAEPGVVKEYLRPVGLYRQRAKRLISLANEMVKRDGVLPEDREELEAIPFMGQYIANAVELVIFNQPSPLVDVNMARVLERFFGPRKMADIRYDPGLQKLAYKIVDHESAKEINWAVLDFAAGVCKTRPLCPVCPLLLLCYFGKKNISLILSSKLGR